MNVPLAAWAAVIAAVLALLAVDLLAHRRPHPPSLREAATWSGIWVGVAAAFGGAVWFGLGADAAGQYAAGYLVEKSLAVDNVFVFAVILGSLGVPLRYQHRVLFLGVIGALVLRAAFIAAGAVLLQRFHWVLYVFGAFLVVTGLRMLRHGTGHDPGRRGGQAVLRALHRLVPVTDSLHGQRFLVRQNGRWVATPLLAALVLVECADVVFAVDSVPAVFAVTQEPFLVFSSNVFAILGLRAMYFLLVDLLGRFVYLTFGLALILVGVGVKLLLLDVYPVPLPVALGFITLTLTVCIAASLHATRDTGGPSSTGRDSTGRDTTDRHSTNQDSTGRDPTDRDPTEQGQPARVSGGAAGGGPRGDGPGAREPIRPWQHQGHDRTP